MIVTNIPHYVQLDVILTNQETILDFCLLRVFLVSFFLYLSEAERNQFATLRENN